MKSHLYTEIVNLITRMILKAARDGEGGNTLLMLEEVEMELLTLVVTLSQLANTGTTIAVVGCGQLYLRTTSF